MIVKSTCPNPQVKILLSVALAMFIGSQVTISCTVISVVVWPLNCSFTLLLEESEV